MTGNFFLSRLEACIRLIFPLGRCAAVARASRSRTAARLRGGCFALWVRIYCDLGLNGRFLSLGVLGVWGLGLGHADIGIFLIGTCWGFEEVFKGLMRKFGFYLLRKI